MNNIIKINDLTYKYEDGTIALDKISMNIKKNSKAAILGSNGAGKSTLLLHLNGVLKAQRGNILIDNIELNKKTAGVIRRKIGLIFQDPDDQVFSSTVYDDLAFGLVNMGFDEDETQKRIKEISHIFGITDLLGKNTFNLSYGQKKRVAIAGVIVMKPEIIVLDEPVAFLDPKTKNVIFNILEDLHKKGHTIIITTHNIDFACEWANDFIILNEGHILEQGTQDILLNEELVNEANIDMPIITKVFKKAIKNQLFNLPVTQEEAINLLKSM